jgi:hypothetical protein
MKKKCYFIVLFFCLSAAVFSGENEKLFSVQGSPLIYAADIAYLFMDNDIKTFVVSTDVEFQYAINRYFGISAVAAIFFEKYLNSYTENSGGRYDEDYGQQFQFLLMPAFMYRPFGTWLKGMYAGIYPVIGWTHAASEHLDSTLTNLGFGIHSGYQWIFGNGFTLQLGGGISKIWILPFQNNRGAYRAEDEWHFFNLPFDFRLVCRLGYSF